MPRFDHRLTASASYAAHHLAQIEAALDTHDRTEAESGHTLVTVAHRGAGHLPAALDPSRFCAHILLDATLP
ncbi:MAG: hypothetical protein AAF513_03395 [Pseudomonadota bacterium]